MPDISQINLTDENTSTSVVYNLRDDGVPHSSLTPVQSGLDLSLVTTGEKYRWEQGGRWEGTQAEYDALTTHDPNIEYFITDGNSGSLAITDLSDVTVSSIQNGQVLGYSNGVFINTDTVPNASKVNNLTVQTAVPANAVFTDTTYSAGTGLSLSGTTFSVKTGYTTSGNNRAVQADANGNLYVTQKDDNTTYTLGTSSNNVTLTPSSGSVQSITVPYATKAGSSNSAGTAETWATARNLTIGNTAKSVNGSAAVSWPNPLKIGYCGSDSANTAGWYRIMTVSQSGYTDTNLNLLITSGYSKNAAGILHVHVRCNNGTANVLQSLCWISRIGWGINEVYYKDHGNNTWSLYVYQSNTQYGRVQIQILTETGTSASQQNITLLNNGTRESSLSGGTQSWESTLDVSSNFTVSGNFQSVTKKCLTVVA